MSNIGSSTAHSAPELRDGTTLIPPAGHVPVAVPDPAPSATATAADIAKNAHLQRHGGKKLLSRTSNIIVRTTTTPAKGMTMPALAGPKLNEMTDFKPATDELAPVVPETAQKLEKGRGKHVGKAAKNQVPMLANVSGPQSGKTKVAASVARINEITQPGGLANHAATLFNKPGQAAQLTQLLHTLDSALQPVAGTDHHAVHSTVMPLTKHVLILQHLAHVTGGDAGRALAALDALREGSFLPLPGRTNAAPVARSLGDFLNQDALRSSSDQAQLDALSVAAHLASTPTEFQALLSVMQAPLNEQQSASVKRLLEATAHIEMAQGGQVDLLHHTTQALLHAETGKATLAQTVLHIETSALQGTGDIYANLKPAEKSAIFSWHNGFRESGPGSDLAKAQGRLAKMSKYVGRASHLQDLKNVNFDRHKPVSSAMKVLDAGSRIAAARLNQAVGRKKSPLAVLGSLGTNNASLMHPEDDLVALYKNTTTAVGLLHAYLKTDVGNKPIAGLQTQLLDLHKPLPAAVEHEAVLGHWASLLATQTPLGHVLDGAAVKTIASKIAADYGVATALPAIEAKLGHWVGRELKVSDLSNWAALHQAPTSNLTRIGITANGPASQAGAVSEETVAEGPTHALETDLGKALRLAHDIGSSSSRANNLTPDGLHQFVRTYMQEHNSGNPVTVANGSSLGLSAAPLTFSLKKISQALQILSPVTVAPRINANFSHAHSAVVSFGSTTHGFEVFVGTQTQKSGALGAGLSATEHPLLKYVGLQFGAAVTASTGTEYAKTRGVMVRSVRPEKEDGSAMDTPKARAEMVAFTDLMFAIAKGQHGDLKPDAVWEKIAGQFFESKSFSIGWQDQNALTPHLTGTIGGSVRVGAHVAHSGSVGGNLAHTFDWTPSGANGRKEETGANRLLRNTNFTRAQQITSVGAVIAGSTELVHAADAAKESLILPQLSKTWNFQISDKGFSSTFRTIVEKGKLSDPFTLRDMEERDAKNFVKILQQPERYAQYLQVFNGRYGVENGKRKLDEFAEKTRNWAGPGQHYVMRSRVKADVRGKLDKLAAMANAVHKQDPKSPVLQDISNTMLHLLRNEASWVPIEIMALEAQTARDAMGINFGVQFAAQDSVVTDRELSFVAVPLPVANDWVRTPTAGTAPVAIEVAPESHREPNNNASLPAEVTPAIPAAVPVSIAASTTRPVSRQAAPLPGRTPITPRTPEPQEVQRPSRSMFGKLSSKFADLKNPVRKELRHMSAQALDGITQGANDGSSKYREARKELDKRLKFTAPVAPQQHQGELHATAMTLPTISEE